MSPGPVLQLPAANLYRQKNACGQVRKHLLGLFLVGQNVCGLCYILCYNDIIQLKAIHTLSDQKLKELKNFVK